MNGAEADVIVIGLESWGSVRYEIVDARGRVVARGAAEFGRVEQFTVPAGGRLAATDLGR